MPQPHTKKSNSKVSQGVVAQIQFHQLLVAAQDRGDVEAALMGKATPPQPSCQVQKQKASEHRLLLCHCLLVYACFQHQTGVFVVSCYKGKMLWKVRWKCDLIRTPIRSPRLIVKLAPRLMSSQPETTTAECVSELPP